MPETKMSVYDWFTFGERGLSSEAMMRHIFKMRDPARPNANDHPHDPADLRRCRLALEQTGMEHAIYECGSISPTWGRIVAGWKDLCKTMDEEAPDWRDRGGRATRTYAMMQALLYPKKEESAHAK